MSQSVGVGKHEVECAVCENLQFELSDGLFFCSECGTQSQDVREEVTEDVENTSYVRTLKASTARKKSAAAASSRFPKNMTVLEKMNIIIQLQCDALIGLGYDKSLKEAAKCIWFLYLKKYRYAFQDDQPTSSRPPPATPTSSCPSPMRSNILSPGLPPAKKRKVTSSGGVEFFIKEEVTEDSFGGKAPVFDHYPEDNNLFESSLDCSLKDEERSDGEGGGGGGGEGRWKIGEENKELEGLTGNDLYVMLRKTRKVRHMNYFSIRYSIGIVYLGLLLTNQRILSSDLSRFIALNKVPFHNLHSLVPAEFRAGIESLCTYGKNQMTADKIHCLSQDIYVSVPRLPQIPLLDPKWVCSVLLEKLQLPSCFGSMLDNVLTGVHWPCDHKGTGVRIRERRLDLECMALIVILIKMMYRLDDVYEFEQSSKVVTSSSGKGSSSLETDMSKCIYVWEDWIILLCRHLQKTLDEGIPLTARELEFVRDYQSYLDFCRLEIFSKVRPKALNRRRRWVYNPEYYAKVSSVFSEHLLNLKKREDGVAASSPSDKVDTPHELYNWDSFVPRTIPLSALVEDTDDAPWRRYLATPTSTEPDRDLEEVSNSVVLLLRFCSDVVETNPVNLLREVRRVEWLIIRGPLESLLQTATFSECLPSTTH